MSCFCMSPRLRENRQRMSQSSSPRSRSLSSFISTMGEETEGLPTSPTMENFEGAQQFSLRELVVATQNFRESNLLGEGGFGRVFKGALASGQVVAIKQLNQEGMQGSKEFVVECLMLIMLQNQHLVNLIGYCAQGDERLLVYEFMAKGSLETHLFDLPPNKEPLDWNTRMKIALGAIKGLAYLHEVASPPVIYRDLKSANILLDDEYNPKLSDFGLAKLGPVGDNTHVSTRVMGTYGYCAPDYAMSGKLTVKSDIYSFGVVLLELMTGRKAFDPSRKMGEQNLIVWSHPILKDRKRFTELADPLLQGRYPVRAFYQLTIITALCLQGQPHIRPSSSDIASAIEHVASQPYNATTGSKLPQPRLPLSSHSSEDLASSPTSRFDRNKRYSA
ncbi:uncharacterized protein A4U43_C07F23780 [Asparagus officinalis]|uniref:Protein kinase domain-containing protein n=1 Tax=Asparagus officinalis TaxID=4686 RepID=A0A5P1EJM1_ASPOF|nr:probable serine/threonine-protein kinase PBL21 isoform X1 [Asparagus officinalis]ONK64260.1 uncharacterized protein A4U43_C07F23780 [Asparagus officinalis]